MKHWLRYAALGLFVSGLLTWLGSGAHVGWTQTAVPVKIHDEITGIDGISYQRKYVPGVDFLAVTTLGAGLLLVAAVLLARRANARQAF
jgi:hypothetical protein